MWCKRLTLEKYIRHRMKWFFSPPFLSVSAFLLLNLAKRQCYAYVIGLFTRPEIKIWPHVIFCDHAQCVLPRCCVRYIVFVFYLELFPGPVALEKIIDCVYRHDKENPWGSTPLHLPYRYWFEIRSIIRICMTSFQARKKFMQISWLHIQCATR